MIAEKKKEVEEYIKQLESVDQKHLDICIFDQELQQKLQDYKVRNIESHHLLSKYKRTENKRKVNYPTFQIKTIYDDVKKIQTAEQQNNVDIQQLEVKQQMILNLFQKTIKLQNVRNHLKNISNDRQNQQYKFFEQRLKSQLNNLSFRRSKQHLKQSKSQQLEMQIQHLTNQFVQPTDRKEYQVQIKMIKPNNIEIFEETALSFMKKYYKNVYQILELIDQAEVYSVVMTDLISQLKVDCKNGLEYDLIEKIKNTLLEKMRFNYQLRQLYNQQ